MSPTGYAVFGCHPSRPSDSIIQSIYSHYPIKLISANFANPKFSATLSNSRSRQAHVDQERARHARWLYIFNYGGGIVCGDHIVIETQCLNGATGVIATQGYNFIYSTPSDKIFRPISSPSYRTTMLNQHMESSQQFMHNVYPNGLLVISPHPTVCLQNAIHHHSQFVTLYWDSEIDQLSDFKPGQTTSLSSNEIGSVVLIDWLGAGRLDSNEYWDFDSYNSINEVWIQMLKIRGNQDTNVSTEKKPETRTDGNSNKPLGIDLRLKEAVVSSNTKQSDYLNCASSNQSLVSIICRDGMRLHNDSKRKIHCQMSPYTCMGICILLGPRLSNLIQKLKHEFVKNRKESSYRYSQWKQQTEHDDIPFNRNWMQSVIVTGCPVKKEITDPLTSKNNKNSNVRRKCVRYLISAEKRKLVEGIILKCAGKTIRLVAQELQLLLRDLWVSIGSCPFSNITVGKQTHKSTDFL